MNDIVTSFFSVCEPVPAFLPELLVWLVTFLTGVELAVSVFRCVFYLVSQIITKLEKK